MIHTDSKSHSFLIEKIEVCTANSTVYLRVTTQPVNISQADIQVLKRVKRWDVDAAPCTFVTKMVALDQKKSNLIINLFCPFNVPIPVTLGSTPEMPAPVIADPSSPTSFIFQQDDDLLDDPDFDPDAPLEDVLKQFVK